MSMTIELTLSRCCCANCGIVYGVPQNFRRSLEETHRTFYCPNGHAQWIPAESEAEKLQRELKRKEQELAEQVQARINAQNELNKHKTRSKNGVCPCCKRTFKQLAAHMKNKHPEYA